MIYKNDRVFDVFVSSTKKDLERHREIAINAIRQMGHRPFAMELFDQDDGSGTDYIERHIQMCDIFILILGRTFGSPANADDSAEDEEAYVAWEYKTAQKYGLRIVAFVPDDSVINSSELPESVVDFRSRLLNAGKIRGFHNWTNYAQFKEDLIRSIETVALNLEQSEMGGWVRADVLNDYVERSRVNPALINSPTLSEIVQPLCDFDELLPNIDNDIDEKNSIGRFLWRMLSVALEAEGGIRRIFLDGGSTTYWICRAFNKHCGGHRSFYHNQADKKLTVATNSILNFLELSTRIEGPRRPYRTLRLYPAPQVDRTFGKSFGSLVKVTPEPIYGYEKRGWTIKPRVLNEIIAAADEFRLWQSKNGGHSLTILSSAGLVIDGEYSGPWVKSHSSMLQQQAIFRAEVPTILAIDGKKWNLKPKEQQGYRVLFDDYGWDDFVQTAPFACAISTFIEEKADEIKRYFRGLGFEILSDEAENNMESRTLYRILAFNEKFSPLTP